MKIVLRNSFSRAGMLRWLWLPVLTLLSHLDLSAQVVGGTLVVQPGETFTSTVNNATTAPYITTYLLVCGGTVSDQNTSGTFTIPTNSSAPMSCQLYAINHNPNTYTPSANGGAYTAPSGSDCASVVSRSVQIINCIEVCENEPIVASISGNNTSGFALSYFLVCNDAVTEISTTGSFGTPSSFGLDAADDCSVYAINYATGTTLPALGSTYSTYDWMGACYSEISRPVCINPLFEVCEKGGSITTTISGANTTLPYVLEYFLVCGTTVQEKNTDGVFDFTTAPLDDVTAGNCTVYAVNHDGTFTQAQDAAWMAPATASCATIKQACVIVNPLPLPTATPTNALCNGGNGSVSVAVK